MRSKATVKEPDPPQGYGLPRGFLVMDIGLWGTLAGPSQEGETAPVIFSSLEFDDAWVTRDALKILVCRLQEGLNSSLGACD